jgi:hypothetical protein
VLKLRARVLEAWVYWARRFEVTIERFRVMASSSESNLCSSSFSEPNWRAMAATKEPRKTAGCAKEIPKMYLMT